MFIRINISVFFVWLMSVLSAFAQVDAPVGQGAGGGPSREAAEVPEELELDQDSMTCLKTKKEFPRFPKTIP